MRYAAFLLAGIVIGWVGHAATREDPAPQRAEAPVKAVVPHLAPPAPEPDRKSVV